MVLLRGEPVQVSSAVSEKLHSTQNRKSEKAINAAYQNVHAETIHCFPSLDCQKPQVHITAQLRGDLALELTKVF